MDDAVADILKAAGTAAAFLAFMMGVVKLLASAYASQVANMKEVADMWKEQADTCQPRVDSQMATIVTLTKELQSTREDEARRNQELRAEVADFRRALESRWENYERALERRDGA